MVEKYLVDRGIKDKKIINAFKAVPREEYVLQKYKDKAYEDVEIPIAFGDTLNRPYEDAIMMESLELGPDQKILEIGTGTGYLTSLLAQIVDKVYTIEIEPEYAERAKKNFETLGYKNIFPLTGDGFAGWPDFAPFDRIILMCSPPKIPLPLQEQLIEDGLLLLPLGGNEKFQELVLFRKKNGKLKKVRSIAPTTFTPMKGKILEKSDN